MTKMSSKGSSQEALITSSSERPDSDAVLLDPSELVSPSGRLYYNLQSEFKNTLNSPDPKGQGDAGIAVYNISDRLYKKLSPTIEADEDSFAYRDDSSLPDFRTPNSLAGVSPMPGPSGLSDPRRRSRSHSQSPPMTSTTPQRPSVTPHLSSTPVNRSTPLQPILQPQTTPLPTVLSVRGTPVSVSQSASPEQPVYRTTPPRPSTPKPSPRPESVQQSVTPKLTVSPEALAVSDPPRRSPGEDDTKYSYIK